MFVVGRIFAIRAHHLEFGVGPKLGSFQWKDTQVILRLLPINAFVRFYDNRYPESAGDPKWSYESRPGWIRFLVPFLGFTLPTLLAALLLGMENAAEAFLPVVDFLKGSISPQGHAQDILQGYLAFFQQHGYLKTAALSAFALGTLGLLPSSPNFGMGQALVALKKEVSEQGFIPTWAGLSALLTVLVGIVWLVAALLFIFK